MKKKGNYLAYIDFITEVDPKTKKKTHNVNRVIINADDDKDALARTKEYISAEKKGIPGPRDYNPKPNEYYSRLVNVKLIKLVCAEEREIPLNVKIKKNRMPSWLKELLKKIPKKERDADWDWPCGMGPEDTIIITIKRKKE